MGVTSQDIVAAAADLNRTSVSGPRILARISDPEIPSGEISRLVSNDVHLTVRVLRVANSALYGHSRRITHVDHAVTMLGLDAIRSIVVASCFRNNFGCARSGGGPIDYVQYYRHSLSVAIGAEKLARIRQPHLATEAFVAGLLHDFGMQILVRVDADGTEKLRDALLAEPAADTAATEAATVAAGHEECGTQALRAWSFPEGIAAVAGGHHRPLMTAQPHRELACLIHVADNISHATGAGLCLESKPSALCEDVLQVVGLNPDEVATIGAGLSAQVDALDHLLN